MTFYFESAYEVGRDLTKGALQVARVAVAAATERILAPIDEHFANRLNTPEDE